MRPGVERYAPPGWIVKNMLKVASPGSGNGVRSSGMGVMLIVRAICPSSSRITVPAGRCSSSPGMRGVVMTVSLIVGDAIVTWCAVSMSGDQIVNGSTLVPPARTTIRAS